jgi:hypothetical protein
MTLFEQYSEENASFFFCWVKSFSSEILESRLLSIHESTLETTEGVPLEFWFGGVPSRLLLSFLLLGFCFYCVACVRK